MSNPHFDAALECLDPEGDFNWENSDLANLGARLEAQTQATLALAYEARTANLIAFANACETGQVDNGGSFRQAATRLGLGDTK